MSVIFVAIGAITVGLIFVGILSSLKGPANQCGTVMLKDADKDSINIFYDFNVCVKTAGHEGLHMCANGREFS